MRSQMRYIGYPVSYPISYHIPIYSNSYNTYIRCLTGLNWNFHRGKQTQLGWDSAANQIARCKFTTCVGEVWQNGQRNPGFSQSACAVWAFSTRKKARNCERKHPASIKFHPDYPILLHTVLTVLWWLLYGGFCLWSWGGEAAIDFLQMFSIQPPSYHHQIEFQEIFLEFPRCFMLPYVSKPLMLFFCFFFAGGLLGGLQQIGL